MDVDGGVLRRLLIQQREGQRHSVLRSVPPPDSWTQATVALDQNEVLLAVTGRR